jgi:glycosyltransferase involved in cell wall biosynthesis
MKVLQINTVYGIKSTGRTCVEVEHALHLGGHECYTAYGNKRNNSEFSYRIGSSSEYYFHNIMARITGLQGYFSFFATKRLIRYINKLNPDIIHLRNLHANYLNLPLLFKYLRESNKPIVLNLHDCWAFTGKCAYYTERDCYKWIKECKNCPSKKDYPQSYFFDFSSKMFNDKKKGFSSIKNLTVIGVSDWIANQAKESFLKGRDIRRVYNWINQDIFKPYDENILSKYGIDNKKFIIIGVSANWNKGTPRYEDFIKLSEMIDGSMQIIMVGKTEQSINSNNILHIPYVSDTVELAKLYSSSDVYVHFSVEDTFGKVIAESLACGTPAIVYDSTGCSEVVTKNCGFIVDKRNVKEVYQCILKVKSKGKPSYSNNCVLRVENEFNYLKNTKKLIEIYGDLINDKR